MTQIIIKISIDKLNCFEGDSSAFFVVPEYADELLKELKKVNTHLEGIIQAAEKQKNLKHP